MQLLSSALLASLVLPSMFLAQEKVAPLATRQSESTRLVLDINQASAQDFTKLPGIGPALGRRIVAFREKHGPFRRVEDLLAIRGIGHKKWKAIRPYLRVGPARRGAAPGVQNFW